MSKFIRTTFAVFLLVIAGATPLVLLVAWLPAISEIEAYDGYHTGRAVLFGLSLVLGITGSLAAGMAYFLCRPRKCVLLALLALNLCVAVVVSVYAYWPRTPEVMRAVNAGNTARIRMYANLSVDLDARSRWGWYWHSLGHTPLTAAVEKGDLAMVEALLDAGASVRSVNGWNHAPIHQAVQSGRPEIIDLLLRRGADIHQDPPVIPLALSFGRFTLVPQLLSNGADPNAGEAIFMAIELYQQHLDAWQAGESDVIDALRQLATAGADLERVDGYRRTPLTAAIHAARPSYVPILLQLGANVNLVDGNRETPLITAAKAGDLRSLRSLLAAGADVNQSANHGRSPLTAALMGNQREVAAELLKAGADINQEDSFGDSPITAAIDGSDPESPVTLRFVLDHGAQPSRINFASNRPSPLARAVETRRLELAAILLGAGANPNEQHLDYETPLLVAVKHGHLPMVRLLIERGADLNLSIRGRASPLRLAQQKNYDPIASLLREHGARLSP